MGSFSLSSRAFHRPLHTRLAPGPDHRRLLTRPRTGTGTSANASGNGAAGGAPSLGRDAGAREGAGATTAPRAAAPSRRPTAALDADRKSCLLHVARGQADLWHYLNDCTHGDTHRVASDINRKVLPFLSDKLLPLPQPTSPLTPPGQAQHSSDSGAALPCHLGGRVTDEAACYGSAAGRLGSQAGMAADVQCRSALPCWGSPCPSTSYPVAAWPPCLDRGLMASLLRQ